MLRSTRRHFLQQSAGLGLGLAAGTTTLTSLTGRAVAANETIGVACIGVRGRGNALIRSFAEQKGCVITHICAAHPA